MSAIRKRNVSWRSASLLAALALSALAVLPGQAAADVSDFGFTSVGASLSTTEAGAHPDLTTEFLLNGDPSRLDSEGQPAPWGVMRNLSVELPPGFVGNPQAFPTCSAAVLASFSFSATEFCPTDSQIGVVSPGLWNCCAPGLFNEPLYNLPSPGGDVVARLGFVAVFYPVFIDVRVDPERDNALTATIVNAPSNADLTGTKTTLWGVPTSPIHDAQRLNSLEALICTFGSCPPPRPSGLAQTAFLSSPTSCEEREVGFAANNYALPSRVVRASTALPELSGCESLPFQPSMSLKPTTSRAGAPSGLDVSLSMPQANLTNPGGARTSDLKSVAVTLPKGLTLNPSAAAGLGSCSEAEIGIASLEPLRFNSAAPSCPPSSKVGTVKITTPVLSDPIEGSLYVAKQADNPFGSLLAGYLVAQGSGVTIKLAGRFNLSPQDGQITATFDNNPQLPFSQLQLHFQGGTRGVLTMPSSCGSYSSHYELVPWSGGATVSGDPGFSVSEDCEGSASFSPKLRAGTNRPVAGAFAPFQVGVSREAAEQNLSSVSATLPPGELAKLAGVALCSDPAAKAGSCPAASRIGSVSVAVGSGALPLELPQHGRPEAAIYLAGPYQGAPYSAVVEVPAQAGPFDLGVVAVRSGIYVDPVTAQVSVRSDRLPQILQGIPVLYRDIRIDVDRKDFSLNPTSCAPKSVRATLTSPGGAVASPVARFQLGDCAALPFRPKLGLRLTGPSHRRAHPRLVSTLHAKAGEANIARAQVKLPPAAFLDQSHIGTVCTRVQFAADACPPGSIYGKASARTPLLDQELSGPVYLRSSNHPLPDLVARLRTPGSQPIEVDLVGKIDSVNRSLRSTFEAVPDAPVSSFRLELFGGRRGLIELSGGLCKRRRATIRLQGQNGKTHNTAPVVAARCPRHRQTGKQEG